MGGSSHVFIVCSPRARVGKTLTARLITEFYYSSKRPVTAYDLEPFEPALAEFLPRLTTRVSIEDTPGQIALFDELIRDDDRARVVDLGHFAFEKFFTVAYETDFAAEARRRGISALVMYVADQTAVAFDTYMGLRERFPDFGFVPVHNDAIARGPDLRRQFPSVASGLAPLRIPQLTAGLSTVIDQRPFSLADSRWLAPTKLADNQREELANFVKRVFRDLREAELSLLMQNLKSSLTAELRRRPAFPRASGTDG